MCPGARAVARVGPSTCQVARPALYQLFIDLFMVDLPCTLYIHGCTTSGRVRRIS